MSFDLAAALRRLKPQRVASRLARRPDGVLPFVASPAGPGAELMLDTCVYIDVLQGRTPGEVDELLVLRIVNHSSVVLSELTHLFGRLDPAHAGTPGALRALRATIEDMPEHRLTRPSVRACGEAGILAGLASRLTGRSAGAELLNDAALLLHASETGCVLLTRNVADFDLLQQLVPQAQIVLYQRR